MYSATMCGLVFGRRKTAIRTWVTNAGYKQFHQYKDCGRCGTYVHRFVYEHFKGGIPDGFVVDHIDGNKLNNAVNNLQVLSVSDNTLKGSTGKVSLEQREDIYFLYRAGFLQREIAECFGINPSRVSQILKIFLKEKL